MKYIKLFENHNKYYYSITSEEYRLSLKENSKSIWDKFGENELNIIKNSLPNYQLKMERRHIYQSAKWQMNDELYIKILRDDGKYIHTIATIVKLDDEWYYVYHSVTNQCYKCDQLEGLIGWIKNIILS